MYCAAARPGGSVYCACHAKGSRGPSGGHARRSSSRRLCVLRLPRERQPRPQRRPRAPQLVQEALRTAPATPKAAVVEEALCTAPATPKAAGAPAAATRAAALPRQRQPRPQRRPRAPQLVQEALRTGACHAKGSRGPAAATRAAARRGGSVYCACHAKGSRGRERRPRAPQPCHAKGSRGPSGGHARRSSARRLCVVRLPRKRQALCTAPACVSE